MLYTVLPPPLPSATLQQTVTAKSGLLRSSYNTAQAGTAKPKVSSTLPADSLCYVCAIAWSSEVARSDQNIVETCIYCYVDVG